MRLQLKVGFNVTVIHLTAKQINLYNLNLDTAAVTPPMATPQASVAAAILPQAITGTPISPWMQAPAMTTTTMAIQPASVPGVTYTYNTPIGMVGTGSGHSVGTFVPSLAGYSGPATNVGPTTGSRPTPTIMLTPAAMNTSTPTPALAPPEPLQPHWQPEIAALAPSQFNAADGTFPVTQDVHLGVPGLIHRQVDTIKALDMAGRMPVPVLVSPMRPSQKRRETTGNSDEDDEGEDDDDDDDDNDGFTQRLFLFISVFSML